MSGPVGAGREAGTAAPACALAAVLVLSSIDRPTALRLHVSGVVLDPGLIAIWCLAAGVLVAWARDRIRPDRGLLAAGAALLGVMVVAGSLSLRWYQVVPYALRAWTPVLALLLGHSLLRGRAGERWLLRGVVAGVGIQASLTLLQWLGTTERPRGSYYTATGLGAYLSLTLVVLAAALLWTTGWRRSAIGVASVAGLLALISSASRVPVAAMIVGVSTAAVAWSSPRRSRVRRTVATATLGTLGLVILLSVATLWYSGPRPDPDSQPLRRFAPAAIVAHFLDLRLPMYRMGLDVWLDHPWLGIGGASRYGRIAREYAPEDLRAYGGRLEDYPSERPRRVHLDHVHQQFLQTGIEYGALGLGAWLFLLGSVGLRLARALAASGTPAWPAAGSGTLAAFLVLCTLAAPLVTMDAEVGILIGGTLGLSEGSRQGAGSRWAS